MCLRLCLVIGIPVIFAWVLWPPLSCSFAADAGVPAGDVAPADGTAQAPVGQVGESGLHWFVRCSGVIGLFIFGLSVYFVAVVIRLFLQMRTEVAVPPEASAGFRALLGQGNYQGAYEAMRASDSFLGRVVVKGIEQLPNGLAEARHGMERIGEYETVRMEKQISIMAVLGTLGPMIGLIGTLKGMISSFSVILGEAQASLLAARRLKPDFKAGDDLPTMVVLRADKKTPFKHLNRVIVACQQNGFRQFSLRALNRKDES